MGKRKKPVVEPYKIVDSSKSDWLKTILPSNIAQAVSKTFLGDARMSNASLTDDQKLILWDTIENAKKRTGSNQGGTEYQDYGGLGHGTSKQYTEWFNKGNIPFAEGVAGTLKNPGFELASTIGRGNYRTDPNDPNTVTYTDVYDWNKGEKMFKGNKVYKIVRNALRNNEESNLTVEKNDPYRMNFKLNKSEIDKIRKKVHPLNIIDAAANTHLQTLPFRMSPFEDGGWLEKYNDGGPVQPNYNDASVSMSEDFVGEGTVNEGRDYSPAWGGQFAMGGALPGATGSMYARYSGGGSMPGDVGFRYPRTGEIPDNGKYAKKTKASAENGTEMKFYQEGLDFKPKSISRDGSQLVKLDQLSNFTNYNTKQPGSWLDKYQ
jgi:hypothetical protein